MATRRTPTAGGFSASGAEARAKSSATQAAALSSYRDDRNRDDWRRASWDEALALIASRMAAAGREAVGLWSGHGAFTSGAPIAVQMMQRFASLYGCQSWHPAMVCWGLGGFGFGLTGALNVNTKEDMAQHANLIVLWGANIASQPNTAPHPHCGQAPGCQSRHNRYQKDGGGGAIGRVVVGSTGLGRRSRVGPCPCDRRRGLV